GWPEWFSRGWTLQELIAPTDLQFFNKDWLYIGDKRNLARMLVEITRVPRGVLEDGLAAYGPSVAQVMSWAADRRTTRVEDRAYSLMGLLDVNMPMLYGEGKKAFLRLQQEIIRKSSDQTIFAWNPTGETPQACCVLADDPSPFRDCHDIVQMDAKEFYSKLVDLWGIPNTTYTGPSQRPSIFSFLSDASPQKWTIEMQSFHAFTVTNMGIHVQLPIRRYRGYPLVLQAALACREGGSSNPIIINLVPWRTKCYRYTGKVGCDPVPLSYQHSQVILAYEGAGAPSGIVIERMDGVAALLLDQCTARTGIKVQDSGEDRFGVTSAEIHGTPGLWLRIFTSVIVLLLKVSAYSPGWLWMIALLGAVPFFEAASVVVGLLWILSEVSAVTPAIRRCASECPSPGEYILGSGTEIVLLRGKGRAVPSVTHGQTVFLPHILQDVRNLVAFLCAILLSSEGLLLELSASSALLMFLQWGLLLCMLSLSVSSLIRPKALHRWSLIQVVYRLKLRKYLFSTRVTGVVFVLLLLRSEKAAEVMNELLPIPSTRAWKKWKTIVLDRISHGGNLNIDTTLWDDGTWTDREREMLVGLFRNARDAYGVFERHIAESAFEHPPV
ncbi:hypothetical protein PISMIDRAFT_682062, partial [Pisolithus microcarpus 441]